MSVLSPDEPTEDQLAARRMLDEARQAMRDRKRLTRRKIIVGAAVLVAATSDPSVRLMLRDVLRARVTRSIDQDIIADLLNG